MDFRYAIEEVMRRRCPSRKTTDITGKVITAQPWKYIDARADKHCVEIAYYCPVGYSALDLMQETDSIAAACGCPIEIIDRFGAVVIKISLHDFPLLIPFKSSMLTAAKWREVLLGYDIAEQKITHDFKNPHILIGGTTGYGKTDLIRFILLQLISRFTPNELWIDIIDGKGFSFLPFKSIPHIRTIARNLEDAEKVMREAREEMEERAVKVWETGNREAAKGFPWRIVLIDEAAVLSPKLQSDKKARALAEMISSDMAKIACTGREAGLSLITSTQRPDANVIHPQVKQNSDVSIALRCKTQTNSEVILQTSGAELLPHDKKGRAIITKTKNVIFQIPYVGEDAVWDKVLAPYVKEGYSVDYSGKDKGSSEERTNFIDVDALPDNLDDAGSNDVPFEW
jgi:S-DNA-T family DNA segregation ATPase FtsK/SpoIIIE